MAFPASVGYELSPEVQVTTDQALDTYFDDLSINLSRINDAAEDMGCDAQVHFSADRVESDFEGTHLWGRAHDDRATLYPVNLLDYLTEVLHKNAPPGTQPLADWPVSFNSLFSTLLSRTVYHELQHIADDQNPQTAFEKIQYALDSVASPPKQSGWQRVMTYIRGDRARSNGVSVEYYHNAPWEQRARQAEEDLIKRLGNVVTIQVSPSALPQLG